MSYIYVELVLEYVPNIVVRSLPAIRKVLLWLRACGAEDGVTTQVCTCNARRIVGAASPFVHLEIAVLADNKACCMP